MTADLRDQLRVLCEVIEDEQGPLTAGYVRARSEGGIEPRPASSPRGFAVTIDDATPERFGSVRLGGNDAADSAHAGTGGDEPTVSYLQHPDDVVMPARNVGVRGVVIAVAAAILVVAGVVVVADGVGSDVATDPPRAADPRPAVESGGAFSVPSCESLMPGLGGKASEYEWTVDEVAFSFTVPQGWYGQGGDCVPVIGKSVLGPQDAEAIIFWSRFPDGHYANACVRLNLYPAADVAAAVAAAPGIELLSGPTDVMVGGQTAAHVAFVVREREGCDPGFVYNWKALMGGPIWQSSEIGDTINVWIVDVDGTLMFIASETRASIRSGLEQEIQQIISSIRFN